MPNSFPILVGATIPTPQTTGNLVRFIDYDGTILKQQYVTTGQNATAPTPPTHALLTFVEWNNSFSSVQRDIDVGATYRTTDGKTYLFCRFTAGTGLQPTLYLNKTTTTQMDITWGDGTGVSIAGSGNVNITKDTPYATAGDYIITINCSTNYGINTGGWIFGNNSTYTFSLIKCLLGNKFPTIATTSFQNCKSLRYFMCPKTVISISTSFAYCSSLEAFVVPEGITSIATQCFVYDYSLKDVILPNSIVTINNWAFFSCKSLLNVILPEHIVQVLYNTFAYNSVKSDFITPKYCTTIENEAITYWDILKNVIIKESCTAIGNLFLYQCTILHDIYILATTPPSLGSNSFLNKNVTTKLFVPDASISLYAAATNWIAHAVIIAGLSQKIEFNGCIFFEKNGGSVTFHIQGTPGAVATAPTAPTKAGVTFAGWYKEAALTNAWNWASDVYPATNITLYAKWI